MIDNDNNTFQKVACCVVASLLRAPRLMATPARHRAGSAAASSRSALPPAPAAGLRVAFLHPDLGLGGAERLVVDAAAGLRRLGHAVVVFTSHYEASRSFAETRSGAFPVRVYGDWLPRALLGRLHIVFATLRMLWLVKFVKLLRALRVNILFRRVTVRWGLSTMSVSVAKYVVVVILFFELATIAI